MIPTLDPALAPDAPVNVLVVDDVPQNLVAMDALLSAPGLCVLKAASGPEALELLLTHEVAVALLDVHMPEMDGFELAEFMRGRESTRSIPLIFLTAAGADQQRSFRGYEAGAVDFLHKPIEPQVISSKVAVFVELYRQKRHISRQMEELKQALQWNEMLMSVLGHDLRTPLMAILMSTEVILRSSKEEASKTKATRIKASGWRMARMIEQLLDLSRIRSGTLHINPAPGNLTELAQAISRELQPEDGPQNIVIHSEGDVNGVFDVDRIQQVISNLIGNALHHGQADSPVHVDVAGPRPDELVFTVRNRGCIPSESFEYLFAPFHRLRPAESKGLGLGLYIVDQFVKAHGGSVQVTSSEVEGTAFEVRLPRVSGERRLTPDTALT